MNAKERAERALRHASIMPAVNKFAVCALVEIEIVQAEREAILAFVERVNARAETNIEKTGKLEGSHYAAMTVEARKIEELVK